ncbi:SRPBCC domain-containing protein [Naasia sp. SYSU D00948]|uniref:SRPBCC family protein n=1 Tax=Naasia sp. SYSU D00948 TaxID=2817379 RepID=UPI001B3060FB|nr:SRPBCC domain-containing protein [Naasia sp. SYSU D00948]
MASVGDEGETFDVDVTRTFDAPVDRVWRAWSEADEVKKWWGPDGFTCPVAEVDLRVGGRALVAMRAPAEYGGRDYYNTWNYTLVEPHSRIEYVSNFADEEGNRRTPADLGLPPGIPDDGRHEVEFRDLGGGRTEMRMVEHGYATAEVRDQSRTGLDQCLDKMARSFSDG